MHVKDSLTSSPLPPLGPFSQLPPPDCGEKDVVYMAAPVHPNKQNFINGLALIFSLWPALKMAREMEWGGHNTIEKIQLFQDGLVDYFDREGRNIEPEDVEEILLEVMNCEFGTLLEDESERIVAKQICTLYQECIRGKSDMLDSLRQRAAQPLALNLVRPVSEDTDSTDSDYEEDDSVDNMAM